MKDEITANYKHHFLPFKAEMASWLWGKRAAGQPLSSPGTTLLGGWGVFSSPSYLTFLCSLPAPSSSLPPNTPGARGREKKGEEVERGL